MECDRQHVGANLLHDGLGADARLDVGESFCEVTLGGGDLKCKATKPPALDIDDLERVVMLDLVLLIESLICNDWVSLKELSFIGGAPTLLKRLLRDVMLSSEVTLYCEEIHDIRKNFKAVCNCSL